MTRAFKKEKFDDVWLVLDALNLSFRYKHKGVSEFTEDYIRTVQSLAHSYNAGKVILVCDKGASIYRKNILPTYKASRKEKFQNQTEEEKQAAEEFFEGFERTIAACEKQFTVLRYQGVEADDLAAYIVKHRTALGASKIWLISSDRDWDLLISEEVSRFSYVTRKEVTNENWFDHYDVTPEDYISFKCLTGDSGDDVPGVEGIGPKRAYDLITKYGSAFDIYDSLPISGTAKYIFNLNNSGDLIPKNYELMDLLTYCEEAIGADNIRDINAKLT